MLFYSESQGGCPCHILRLIIGSRYRKFIYASLLTMSISAGVVRAIALQEVNHTPNAKACAERDHEGLQNI